MLFKKFIYSTSESCKEICAEKIQQVVQKESQKAL